LLPDTGSKPAWETFGRPTAGWLVGYRANLQNLTTHTSLREELTKQLPLKDREKLARLRQSFCLKTNTRTEC
jgi:hypothetical protein